MAHHTPLIATIVIGLVLAFVLGALAHRLRVSPLVGYLLAGVLIGPFTPGYVADQNIADAARRDRRHSADVRRRAAFLAEGSAVGPRDRDPRRGRRRSRSRRCSGMALACALGWTVGAGLVFGLALVGRQHRRAAARAAGAPPGRDRARPHRGRLADRRGHRDGAGAGAAAGAGRSPEGPGRTRPGGTIAHAARASRSARSSAFVALMLVVGRRVIPWMLHYVAHTGSRELFRLAVLAIALGVAFGAAMLFDVSFALGAFFAGMILSESELSHRAAQETLPLRDAFAVLFFVSVGMLFDPMIVLREPLPVLAALLIIVIGKSRRGLRHRAAVPLFPCDRADHLGEPGADRRILVHPGRARRQLDAAAGGGPRPDPRRRDPVDPAQPAAVRAARPDAGQGSRRAGRQPMPRRERGAAARADAATTTLTGHVVLVGYGRVGSVISEALAKPALPILVIEDEARMALGAARARHRGDRRQCRRSGGARGRQPRRRALPVGRDPGCVRGRPGRGAGAGAQSRSCTIIARAHSDAEVEHLSKHGATNVVMGEHEIAKAMIADIPPVSS